MAGQPLAFLDPSKDLLFYYYLAKEAILARNNKLTPQVDFAHVLKEISINSNDPCEVIRELISNAYDAQAKNIWYASLKDANGFIFCDDGEGLSKEDQNGISAYESFFSIGKSTKLKGGDSIGYKCQGAKLCFASGSVTVITKTQEEEKWRVISIDDPRSKLNLHMDITPNESTEPWTVLSKRFSTSSQDTADALKWFSAKFFKEHFTSGTLILVQNLDVENYANYFTRNEKDSSYLINYIKFCTRHGSVRGITAEHGFPVQGMTRFGPEKYFATLYVKIGKTWETVDPGYPYLKKPQKGHETTTNPLELARLSDGKFYYRNAKSFTTGGGKFSVILAVDGNRRALDGYSELDRRGGDGKRSGMRLADQRGVFLAVNGVKVCAYPKILSKMPEYSVLVDDSKARSHFLLIIDGPFELTTSRNSVSGNANSILNGSDFALKLKKVLDEFSDKSQVFGGLIQRLKKEITTQSTEAQLENVEAAKNAISRRERFTITYSSRSKEVFLSPQPGEEYLVGVLYANLGRAAEKNKELWKKILTFSTQGIDSIACNQEKQRPFNPSNLVTVEYKYQFDSTGEFNHMFATVDYIVAWQVKLQDQDTVKDKYGCSGEVSQISDGVWEISEIESAEGDSYDNTIVVIDLKILINDSFNVKWFTPT